MQQNKNPTPDYELESDWLTKPVYFDEEWIMEGFCSTCGNSCCYRVCLTCGEGDTERGF